jgi:hypothetical protein
MEKMVQVPEGRPDNGYGEVWCQRTEAGSRPCGGQRSRGRSAGVEESSMEEIGGQRRLGSGDGGGNGRGRQARPVVEAVHV